MTTCKNALFWLLFLGVTIYCVVPPALTRCAFCCPGPRHRCVVATSEDAHRHTRAQTHTIARTTRTSHHPRLPRRTHTLAHTRLPCRFPTRQQLSLATHAHTMDHMSYVASPSRGSPPRKAPYTDIDATGIAIDTLSKTAQVSMMPATKHSLSTFPRKSANQCSPPLTSVSSFEHMAIRPE